MHKQDQERNQIISLLQRIQKGYTERDLDQVQSFVEDVFLKEQDILVIGTSAVTPESSEWCFGYEEIAKIIEDDWKYWGDLKLNIDDAHISFHGDVSFIAMTGVVYEKIQRESYYNYRLSLIEKKLKDEISPKRKRLEIIHGTADTLLETTKGEDYHWPLRLSMQAVNKEGVWKIKQMHFSYPVTFYPPVRLE